MKRHGVSLGKAVTFIHQAHEVGDRRNPHFYHYMVFFRPFQGLLCRRGCFSPGSRQGLLSFAPFGGYACLLL